MNRIAESLGTLKASAALAATTIASGFSTFLGLIPDDIGKIASIAGLVLTGVMIQYWRKKNDIESRQSELDLELKSVQIQSARLELEKNRREAEHKRRVEDL